MLTTVSKEPVSQGAGFCLPLRNSNELPHLSRCIHRGLAFWEVFQPCWVEAFYDVTNSATTMTTGGSTDQLAKFFLNGSNLVDVAVVYICSNVNPFIARLRVFLFARQLAHPLSDDFVTDLHLIV
jgi:hypothetical protein